MPPAEEDAAAIRTLEALASRHELAEAGITRDIKGMMKPGEQYVKRALQDKARRHSRVAYEARACIRAIKAASA